VHLHGMSFLGRDVELTAPQDLGTRPRRPVVLDRRRCRAALAHGRVSVGAKVVIGGGCIVNAYLDVSIGDGC
jgi:acetyltransferase-like isoleucine patch superfamily enzyme